MSMVCKRCGGKGCPSCNGNGVICPSVWHKRCVDDMDSVNLSGNILVFVKRCRDRKDRLLILGAKTGGIRQLVAECESTTQCDILFAYHKKLLRRLSTEPGMDREAAVRAAQNLLDMAIERGKL